MPRFTQRGGFQVYAERLAKPVVVDGVTHDAGDWMVTHDDGRHEFLDDLEFRERYRPITKSGGYIGWSRGDDWPPEP